MSRLAYRVINPIVSGLLRSPLHGLLSHNTLLLEFTGRRSGRALATPISYRLENQTAHGFTARSSVWWRNLTTGQKVSLTIQGRRWQSTPVVEYADAALMAAQLGAFLRAVPRDAAPSGVRLDDAGNPNPDDIQQAVQRLVYLAFPLEAPHE